MTGNSFLFSCLSAESLAEVDVSCFPDGDLLGFRLRTGEESVTSCSMHLPKNRIGRTWLLSLLAGVISVAASGEFVPNEVEVKFRDGTEMRLRNGAPKSLMPGEKSSRAFERGLADSAARGLTWSRTFEGVSVSQLDGMRNPSGRSAKAKPLPELNLYFRLKVPEGEDPGAWVAELQAWPEVEAAWRIPIGKLPLSTDYSVSNAPASYQQYLDAAPQGMDARFAWELGHTAAGLTVCDIEYDWMPCTRICRTFRWLPARNCTPGSGRTMGRR